MTFENDAIFDLVGRQFIAAQPAPSEPGNSIKKVDE
jgi:hypothetical protein